MSATFGEVLSLFQGSYSAPSDPGAARYALAPGYLLPRFQRELVQIVLPALIRG